MFVKRKKGDAGASSFFVFYSVVRYFRRFALDKDRT